MILCALLVARVDAQELFDRRLADDQRGPAETLSGADLLHQRLAVQRLVLDDQVEEAAEILQGLVGTDPGAHWSRSLIAFEAEQLRFRDSRSRQAFLSSQFEVSFDEDPPVLASRIEDWVEDWFPYVEPLQILQSARYAKSRGRWSDALGWYRMTVQVTPVTDPSFLMGVNGILNVSLQADDLNIGVLRTLETLTANTALGAEDLVWLQEQLNSFLSFPQARSDPASPTLLDRFPGGRLGLAFRLRQGSFRSGAPELGDEDLLAYASEPIDRAALLLRAATRIRLSEPDADEITRSLREAAFSVPPSRIAHEIAAALMLHLAEHEGTDADLQALVHEHFVAPQTRWRGLLSAMDDVFVILLEQDRHPLLRQLAVQCMRVVGEHPYRARLLQLLAEIEPDRTHRSHLLRWCLEEPRLAGRALRPAQLLALRDHADLLHERGQVAAAADHLARCLALTPGTLVDQQSWFDDYLRWSMWRVEAREHPFDVAREVLQLIGDGTNLGFSDLDRTMETIVEVFEAGGHRATLVRVMQAHRDELREAGVDRSRLEFLGRALMLARTNGPFVRAALADFEARTHLPDEVLYRWLEQAHEEQGEAVAMRLLLAGAATSSGNRPRFATPPPATLRDAWQEALLRAGRRDEVEILCAALSPHPDAGTRRTLVDRLLAEVHGARGRVVEALNLQVAMLDEVPAVEHAMFERLLPLVGQGNWDLLPACHAIQPERAVRELREAYLNARSTDQRVAMIRQLAELSRLQAEELLVSLGTFPGVDIRAGALDVLRRLRRSGHLDALPRLLELAAVDPSPDIRWRVAVSFRPPVTPAEVPVLLELLNDPEVRVNRAAEARLFLLAQPELAQPVVDFLIEKPELLDREPVLEMLHAVTGRKWSELTGLDLENRRARLRRTDDGR